MSATLQVKRGTAAAWTSNNPTLANGEPGLETDTGLFKWGDGVTSWTGLAYAGGGSTFASVVAGTGLDVDSTDPDNPIVLIEAGVLSDIGDAQADATSALAGLATKADSSTLTNHTANTSNPHATTAAQVGADPTGSAAAAQAAAIQRANHTGSQAQSTITNLVTDLAAKAPLVSPPFTGTPTVPTAALGTNTTQAASTAFVAAADAKLRQYPPRVTPQTETFIHPFAGTQIATRIGFTPVNDRMYFLPGYVTIPTDVSEPRINVQAGGAGSNCRVGICEWDVTTGLPGTLLVDWGTTATTAGGFSTFSNGTAIASLLPGQAYAIRFIIGGGTAPGMYYIPLVPLAIPAVVETGSTLSSIAAWIQSAQSAQRTGGFTVPVNTAGMSLETAVNIFGMRTFVHFLTVVPTP